MKILVEVKHIDLWVTSNRATAQQSYRNSHGEKVPPAFFLGFMSHKAQIESELPFAEHCMDSGKTAHTQRPWKYPCRRQIKTKSLILSSLWLERLSTETSKTICSTLIRYSTFLKRFLFRCQRNTCIFKHSLHGKWSLHGKKSTLKCPDGSSEKQTSCSNTKGLPWELDTLEPHSSDYLPTVPGRLVLGESLSQDILSTRLGQWLIFLLSPPFQPPEG